jgi:hypothetical protein
VLQKFAQKTDQRMEAGAAPQTLDALVDRMFATADHVHWVGITDWISSMPPEVANDDVFIQDETTEQYRKTKLKALLRTFVDEVDHTSVDDATLKKKLAKICKQNRMDKYRDNLLNFLGEDFVITLVDGTKEKYSLNEGLLRAFDEQFHDAYDGLVDYYANMLSGGAVLLPRMRVTVNGSWSCYCFADPASYKYQDQYDVEFFRGK